jgi:hypothetical protein
MNLAAHYAFILLWQPDMWKTVYLYEFCCSFTNYSLYIRPSDALRLVIQAGRLQVRIPMRSLDFSVDFLLPAAL